MDEELREMLPEELSAVCSNLAKACSKQMRNEEATHFSTLANYYEKQAKSYQGSSFENLALLLEEDLSQGYVQAHAVAKEEADRGAKRALVWGEKASKFLKNLLARYEKQGNALLESTNVYVCDICGFVYVGDQSPEVCPVCKVPSFKILPVRKEAI